jgi:hypothetical protein
VALNRILCGVTRRVYDFKAIAYRLNQAAVAVIYWHNAHSEIRQPCTAAHFANSLGGTYFRTQTGYRLTR